MATKDYRDAYVAAHVSNTVASQVSMLREKEGWTQKQFAKKAGMSQSRISALEDPNYENYEIGTLKRVASAFDVALTVRFIPFSELAEWSATLSTDRLNVPSYSEDRSPMVAQTVSSIELNRTGFVMEPPSIWQALGSPISILSQGHNQIEPSNAALIPEAVG
jgi:transcriptional regulator with XRE-family HTH domain